MSLLKQAVLISTYIHDLYEAKLKPSTSGPVPFLMGLTTELATDCEHVATVAARAFLSRGWIFLVHHRRPFNLFIQFQSTGMSQDMLTT